MTGTRPTRPRGPIRAPGAPVGPEEVRSAVLEAAGRLFAQQGVDAVSLRDVAAEANVHVALIGRYVGTRDELVAAAFDHLSQQVAQSVIDKPLAGQGFGADTAVGRWVRIAAALVIADHPTVNRPDFNPVMAMAQTLSNGYGVDDISARLRAAQIVAAALGWRIFEDYLIEAGRLDELPLEEMREDLARNARRLGATPWPSPPDPARRDA